MRLNKPADHMRNLTHEGAPAFSNLTTIQQLRRSVLSCLLWEKQHYEDGKDCAKRIEELTRKVTADDLAALAIEARHEHGLRHAPLLLLEALTITGAKRKDSLVRRTIADVIDRVDEITEFLALYWRKGRHSISGQMKKGLADALNKFDAYQFGKYAQGNHRDDAVKLRDVMFMVHPKPKDAQQKALFDALESSLRGQVDNKLESADTWEAALSAGADKNATFTRLLATKKLGYLALLRNLRNMEQSGVDHDLIKAALLARKGADKVFPFRFIAAAKAVPQFEHWIDEAMLAHFATMRKLPGKTLVIVDVSGSMYRGAVSEKSDMSRALAASALGAIARELCEDPRIYATAGSDIHRQHLTEMVPPRRGMALVDAIYGLRYKLGGGGIFLRQVCEFVRKKEGDADRTIVITDEVDCDIHNKKIASPIGRGFLINVASYKNGIGYGPWTHIDGFSESVFKFITATETPKKSETWSQFHGRHPDADCQQQ
jgi:60 kDa SS-A/Ro ribonucleoprotein